MTVQLKMDMFEPIQYDPDTPYEDKFKLLLAEDLDFHGENSTYASHDFHAFPAKFPPQLPRKFIQHLTAPGDLVLDPMMGSGTTIVEAFLCGRGGIGFDIDPLALRLCKSKVTPLDIEKTAEKGYSVLEKAQIDLRTKTDHLRQMLDTRFDDNTRKFIDYWFAPETQLELLALILAVEAIEDATIREFFELAFSAVIITKSGGVSLARDLAHTRPHRVKGKAKRSVLVEFNKRFKKNLNSLTTLVMGDGEAKLHYGNAQKLALKDNTIDLIVTSPPYASNAIDYMRAHKFSLVWFEHTINELSQLRKEYIGGEATSDFQTVTLPVFSAQVVSQIGAKDRKKANVLHRYYSEMTHSLYEMYRVLKPGKAAVIVVGSSTMRGVDTLTQTCLGEIGQRIGFELIDIAVRKLDRDKRMMPARKSGTINSQIEERMHEEYVIGFIKPGL